jgi:hypothetical protein
MKSERTAPLGTGHVCFALTGDSWCQLTITDSPEPVT